MALNQTVYFPNPASASTKTVGETSTTVGSTLFTAPGGAYVHVKGFTITLHTKSGGSVADYVVTTLRIGSGYYTFSLKADATIGYTNTASFSSKDVNFEGGWLQPGDPITTSINKVTAGGMTFISSVSVELEDYAA